ncbi:MAG: cytochrome c [Candidatus Omnitrophota bacterium]|nr:cytochrome c [Candidatus Omnitrophota bacterium]
MNLKVVALVSVMYVFSCMAAAKQADAEERDPDLLYRAKCTACHRVYPPRKYTYQKLETYVTRYGKGLSDEERRRLLEYLKENAKQGEGAVKISNN